MTEALDLVDEWGPEKIVVVSHRRTGMKGVLVVDNTARGVGKGGTRMAPSVTVADTARLARVMTWKWAAVDLFYGGAKAGIVADPSAPDKEAILRAFARALVQDEVGDRGAAVGTPAHLGGVAYDELGVTGYGVAEAADAAARHLRLPLAGARVAVQGFGAVGGAAARRFIELGATVVAVSVAGGGVHDPDGLDVEALLRGRAESGDAAVTELAHGKRLAPGEELTVDCDVLVPAACQDVVDAAVARQVRARLVVEGANLPTTPEAREVLARRSVTVVPDFVANAGGVVAAAFAMDARYSGFRPDTDAVFASVAAKLRANTDTVLALAHRDGVTPHRAARDLAESRVRAAMRSRGSLAAS